MFLLNINIIVNRDSLLIQSIRTELPISTFKYMIVLIKILQEQGNISKLWHNGCKTNC